MKKSNLEVKVGIFVLVGLGVLATLVVRAGDFYLKPGYTIRFVFDFVSGIDEGSPVRLAGVTVGEVKSIQIVRDAEGRTRAEIYAWIAQGVYIEQDAEVRINSLGLLGEKYIEILPGTSGGPTLSDQGTLVGREPIVMERLTESGGRLIEKVELTVDNVNKVVADPNFQDNVKDTFSNASKMSGNLVGASADIQAAFEDIKDAAKSARIILARLKDGEGTIGRLLTDDTIAKDLEDFVKDIKANPWKLLKKS